MNKILEEIGIEIKKIRIGLDMTQAEFIELFNKTSPKSIHIAQQKDISTYEKARVCIPADKLEKIRSLRK